MVGKGSLNVALSVEIKKPDQMSAPEKALWAEFRAANSALYSPYFHFDYTQLLGKLREDVHVLIASHTDKIRAFLPFQANIGDNGKIGFARPVGAPMTDYQGFICAQGTKIDVLDAFKLAGFGAFHFSAMIDQQGLLDNYAKTRSECTAADVSDGAKAWRETRDSSYSRHLKSHRRRVRKAEELGERRFEFKSLDQDVFNQLVNWKKQKFSETGKYDVLSADWTMSLLDSLWARTSKDGLWADMHALYFGDQLAAVDLGLTDGVTFHSWMVAYNGELQHLAPGIQLLEELIEQSGALGYSRIDLGEGIDGYKRHYASEPVHISSGFIAASGPVAALSKIYGAAENFGERKLGGFGRLPGKARRRYAQIQACEPNFGGRAKAMLAAVANVGK
jgi:CelD/BcsL family acetyltransferase involved in cellulose biosynthesis